MAVGGVFQPSGACDRSMVLIVLCSSHDLDGEVCERHCTVHRLLPVDALQADATLPPPSRCYFSPAPRPHPRHVPCPG